MRFRRFAIAEVKPNFVDSVDVDDHETISKCGRWVDAGVMDRVPQLDTQA